MLEEELLDLTSRLRKVSNDLTELAMRCANSMMLRIKVSDEELQKMIDALNAKLAMSTSVVQKLEGQFSNEDLERSNEIYSELTSKLDQCNQDINGEGRFNRGTDSSL